MHLRGKKTPHSLLFYSDKVIINDTWPQTVRGEQPVYKYLQYTQKSLTYSSPPTGWRVTAFWWLQLPKASQLPTTANTSPMENPNKPWTRWNLMRKKMNGPWLQTETKSSAFWYKYRGENRLKVTPSLSDIPGDVSPLIAKVTSQVSIVYTGTNRNRWRKQAVR